MDRLGTGGVFAAVIITAVAGSAKADPRLDEIVYSPWVENRTLELESRVGSLKGGPDRGQTTVVEELEYGINDRVSLSLLGKFEQPPGGSSRLDNIALESVIYIGQVPKTGVDVAGYLELGHGLIGQPDGFEGKVLLGKQVGRFQGLFNLILERPLGPRSDQHYGAWGYAASATWRTWGRLRIGVEAFGDLGDDHSFLGRQGAFVGPEIKWAAKPRFLPAEIQLDAGWLTAVGRDVRGANNQLKLNVELERRF